jgi:hypothetical protein
MYQDLLNQLKKAVETNDPIAKSLRTLILNSYSMSNVLSDVNAIYGVAPVEKKAKRQVLSFTEEDFSPKKKAPISTPSISIVAEDDGDQYGNMWKKMLELSDDQFKLRFDKDIRVATDFLNNCRKEAGLELVGEDHFKSFSAAFFDMLRATLSLKVTKKRDPSKD